MTDDERLKILLISDDKGPFVDQDYKILKEYFQTEGIYLGNISIIKKILKLLIEIPKFDVVFCWFATDSAALAVLLSKLFGKKTIIVTGGADVTYVPEIDYGRFNLSWPRRVLTIFALNHANKLLAFSKSGMKSVEKRLGHHPAGLETIYLGVDYEKYTLGEKKDNIALTVGTVKQGNLKRKGIEYFVKSAKYFPNVKFIVAGKVMDDSIEYLKSIASSNVQFTDFIDEEKLIELYQQAKVYVQISRHEGFGLALAEAMCCGCLPVVTSYGSIPEVVGETGYFVTYGKTKETAKAINKALTAPEESGEVARERIKEKFTLEERGKKLKDTINSLF